MSENTIGEKNNSSINQFKSLDLSNSYQSVQEKSLTSYNKYFKKSK